MPPRTFTWKDKQFLLDGQPVQLFSGEIHYPRVPAEYWTHRFQMACAAGLNTVCTYVFWNAHQPVDGGQFDFSGNNNLAEFIRLAGKEGLLVLVRPGPYVCSEWDLGGLPAWLLARSGIQLRCMNEPYLDAVQRYIEAVAAQVAPLQCTRGGPVVMLQVENEYGSYGSDKAYLQWLCDQWRAHGIDVPFFTSDGWGDWFLDRGTCNNNEVAVTINLGSQLERAFTMLDEWRARAGRPDQPGMIGEYWNGWFAHWGQANHVDPPAAREARAAQVADDVRWIRDTGRSMNLYMFHGGTNFGFWAGANYSLEQGYQCDITSYDNAAPLNEHGAPTTKFNAIRAVLGEGKSLPPVPPVPPTIEISPVDMTTCAPLFENIDCPATRHVHLPHVVPMEALGQSHGLILYRHRLVQATGGKRLTMHDVHDAASVFLNGKTVGQVDRTATGGGTVAAREFSGPIVEEDGQQCILTRITPDNPELYPLPVADILEEHAGQHASLVITPGNRPAGRERASGIRLPPLPPEGAVLDILVENHGRINYGMGMEDERKGITRKVAVDPAVLMGWEIVPLPLDDAWLASLRWRAIEHLPSGQPVFFKATFTVDEPGDTFIDTSEFTKGFAWVNGHCLGRFWSIGPQQTLYLPGPWLKQGENEIIVLDMHGTRGRVTGVPAPVWNQLRTGP